MKLKDLIPMFMVATVIVGFISGLIFAIRNYAQHKSACTSQDELNYLLKQSIFYFFVFVIFSVVSCFFILVGLELFVLWILLVLAISIFL